MFFGPCDEIPGLRDTAFVADCQRAYNDWLADFCAVDRRACRCGGRAVADVARRVARGRARGRAWAGRAVFVRPSAYVGRASAQPSRDDDFWSTCQELGVPVAFHPGVHVDTPGACRKFGLVAISENATITNMAMTRFHGGSALGQAVGNPVDMIVTMGRVLMGGVCERYPRLKLVFLERAAGGCLHCSNAWRAGRRIPLERRWLSLLPSEYFARQCYVSFEPRSGTSAAAAERLGNRPDPLGIRLPASRVHRECWTNCVKRIAPLAAPDRARVLGANAIECYGLEGCSRRAPDANSVAGS